MSIKQRVIKLETSFKMQNEHGPKAISKLQAEIESRRIEFLEKKGCIPIAVSGTTMIFTGISAAPGCDGLTDDEKSALKRFEKRQQVSTNTDRIKTRCT